MARTRKTYPPGLKAKVAVEAIKERRTTVQIGQAFGVHPNLVMNWKKQALEQLPEVFNNGHGKKEANEDRDELFKQIGQMKVELDFLKKKAALLE